MGEIVKLMHPDEYDEEPEPVLVFTELTYGATWLHHKRLNQWVPILRREDDKTLPRNRPKVKRG